MKRLVFSIIFIAIGQAVFAEEIGIFPQDCGPLAREEYGVVFYVEDGANRITYFMKGSATDICPKILTGKLISGIEKDLPEGNPAFSNRELKLIKEFVVSNYGSE